MIGTARAKDGRAAAAPEAARFAHLLLEWFTRSGRDFPWRRTTDPYCILVAEFLLQQTTAGQAAAVYEQFIGRYPTPELAAEAAESEILSMLRPLGLPHRTRLLLATLRRVVAEHGGRVPESRHDLERLPGVGPYTARAVQCFGYGQDVAVVDVNVIRVLGRVFGLSARTTRPHRDAALRRTIDAMIPPGRGMEFNLSLLDLAALVCTRLRPRCRVCPVLEVCRYGRTVELIHRSGE